MLVTRRLILKAANRIHYDELLGKFVQRTNRFYGMIQILERSRKMKNMLELKNE